ncbi:thiol peroxidase [Metamycoplasma cloacale]|uniref:Thiol peroxidase n=1 Tax=Metamycoplasma cloacale TaxID=92401 RepID=A0A2Z4LLW2_9BACT|nr:redoxin domain-containing protein [Metamycoplasma cloacale]AWX42762.1 thiol peroxidase [Metamycoplasma cloacale]VEU79423.1 thiol peroxidase [Metamycoplasma cloacale]
MRTITMKNNPLHLMDEEIKINDQVELKGALIGSFEQKLFNNEQKYTVLATFPSINTQVCDMQILELSKISQSYPNINFVSFSADLPTALNSYATLGHPIGSIQMYSDYYDLYVGHQLGIVIKEIHLLARGMFILDPNNRVIYKQINQELTTQVDFEQLINKLNEL